MTDDENSDKWHLRDLQPQAFMKKPGLHPNLSTCPVEFSLTNHYQAAQAPLHVSLPSFSSVEVGGGGDVPTSFQCPLVWGWDLVEDSKQIHILPEWIAGDPTKTL